MASLQVFYSSKKEATDAGYTDYSKANVNKRGQVYPFSGLRGDARELYQAVMSGKETRVRLLDTSSVAANTSNAAHKAVSQVIAEADVVVWACGYGANLFPILTPSGEELALRVSSSGQVHVEDGSANVLERWSGAVIPSLHAMGLGFGFRSNHDGEEARSDGVGIYQKKGATIILGSIFGTQVCGDEEKRRGQYLGREGVAQEVDCLCQCFCRSMVVTIHGLREKKRILLLSCLRKRRGKTMTPPAVARCQALERGWRPVLLIPEASPWFRAGDLVMAPRN